MISARSKSASFASDRVKPTNTSNDKHINLSIAQSNNSDECGWAVSE